MQNNIISPYIITFVISWATAHAIKYIIARIKRDKSTLQSFLYKSGGMPSAHSATSVSMAFIIGLYNGFDSALFALAALIAIIFMYDAMMVRRSCGEQGLVLEQMIKEQKSSAKLRHIALGHTPAEVFAGAVLGLVVSMVVFLATYY
jgi:uncharacterized protein